MKQHRRQEGAGVPVCPLNLKIRRVAINPFRFRVQQRGLGQHILFLRIGNQRAHPHRFRPRVADHRLRQLLSKRINYCINMRLRREYAPDRYCVYS